MRPHIWLPAIAVALLASASTAAADTTPSRTDLEDRVTQIVASKYGPAFAAARTRYVKCPGAGLSHDRAYGSQQPCRFEFGDRTRRRAGTVDFFDDFGGGGEFRPTIHVEPTFRVATAPCSGTPGFTDANWTLKSLRATARDPDGCRAAGAVFDRLASGTPNGTRLPRKRTAQAKDAERGYAALNVWSCTTRGIRTQSVSCNNALGHRISARLTPNT